MRTKTFLSAVSLMLCGTQLLAQGTWTAKADFGGGVRNRGVAFTIGHKGYCGLGIGGVIQQDLWEYDPITNAWTQKAPFPGGGRVDAIAFVVAGKAYVGTGRDGASVDKKDLWQYDPSNNTWTQRASLGGVIRRSAVAFSIGNFGYLGTGQSGTTLLNDFWRYDPNGDQWTQRTNVPGAARFAATGFALNGLGYLGTGLAANSAFKKDLYAFNPANNTWIQRADFGGTARTAAVGFTVGSFGYVGTGQASNGRQADVWRYDAGINSWSVVANAPTALLSGTVFTVGGFAYLATGFTTTAVSSFSEYDPGSIQAPVGTWTQKAEFGGVARQWAVGFSVGTKGYIGLGVSGQEYQRDFWEFDANANSWSQKADFGGTGRKQAVAFSIGSKGYVGTGYDDSYRQDFWEYNPSMNIWTQKQSLAAGFVFGERYAAVGFSIGTKGYIGLGYGPLNAGGLFGVKKDFWEYDPTSNTWTQKADYGGSARDGAVGFSIGSKGYVCTGSVAARDLWEYQPTSNTWTAKADFPGKGRNEAVAFSIGTKGYVGTGDPNSLPYLNDFWEYDPLVNSWIQKAGVGAFGRYRGVAFSIGSKGYAGTGRDLGSFSDFWEYDPSASVGPNCSENQLTLQLNTDYFSSETSWEICQSGTGGLVCSGAGYPSNSTITVECCLPNGCYDLRVFDSFGDGILSPGGYVLKDAASRRIVDNNGNGSTFTTLSQVTNGNNTPWSFCVPLGADALVPASCDQVFTLNSTVTIQVQENPAVTAQLTASPATSGYQICIFDPNGGFRRNVFLSFSAPGTAFPVGTSNALKPTFFNLNFSQAPFLPVNKLLNVRVRGKVNGTFLNCGPACRLVVGTPPCTTTKLTTTANPQISCGAQNVSVNGGQLFCDLVPGANRYRFQFAGPNNYLRNVPGPAAAVNSLASRTLTLAVFQQQPLPCGVPLTVRVQASFDGGVTFCPFGPDCSISVTGCPVQLRSVEDEASPTGLSIWPNPSNGNRLNIRLDGIAADIATVELADAYGKLVRRETLTGTGSGINTVLDLGDDIAEGLYFVTITAGGETFTERVMIVR